MIEFAVRRPVAVLMICIGLTVLGLIAARRIPVQLLPNIQTPEFTVVTTFIGATPEEIENLITSPIERSVSTIAGLESTTSNSERERSEIHLHFKSSINYLETISSLRERLDSAGLPEGSSRPKILRFQANAAPVIRLALKSRLASASPLETSQMIQEVLLRRLEAVDGVAVATLSGTPDRNIEITINMTAAETYNVTMGSIADAIQSHNKSYPAGEVQFQGQRTSVKLGQGLHSLQELQNLIVRKDGAKLIHLQDVANIHEVTQKPSSRAHLQGEDAFVVEVRKEAEANSVRVADEVKKVIQNFLEEYNDRLQGWVLFDQGHQIEIAIDNVGESVFHGGVLAGLVIFVLLQSWWPTFVVSMSMPISILMTFIMMYFTGISFNLMSLAGLALGVGMLVDNSTVVLDNIHLFQNRMDDRSNAALWGTRSVVGAITGSTLSTIAVFGPLAFVDGMIGQMFRDVAATVCYSLLASLFSAVFLIPMLSAVQFSANHKVATTTTERRIWQDLLRRRFYHGSWISLSIDFFRKNLLITKWALAIIVEKLLHFASPLIEFFKSFLTFLNNHTLKPFLGKVAVWIDDLEVFLKTTIPKVILRSGPTVGWAVGLTLAGIVALSLRGAELFPDESADRLVYDIEFGAGQTIDVTESRISALEKRLIGVPGLISVSSSMGESGSHLARLTVQVDEKKSLQLSHVVASELNKEPGMTYNRTKEALVGEGKPVQLEIYNDDLAALKTQARDVRDVLHKINGLVDLESNIKSDISEVVIRFSKDSLSWFGTDAGAFAASLKPMLMGQPGGLIQIQGEEWPVQIRVPANAFSSIDNVKYASIPQDSEHRLYLSQVSQVEEHKILASIKHINRKRVATLAANVYGTDLESIGKKIRAEMGTSFAANTINWKMGGQDEERARSQKSLLLAIGLSIFLIYLMLAGQFENLLQPVIILCAVPLCASGVALFLYLFGLNVSALVFVGFIILVGVSVNTSIVMVDFANQMVAQGKSLSDAISEATVRRMRPILVTTLSGILGLVPMAFAMGQGSAMQQPLAVTMIGGHLSSTVLTLLIVPIVYVRLAQRRKNESAQ